MLVKPVSARAQMNAEGCRLHQPFLNIANDSHYQSQNCRIMGLRPLRMKNAHPNKSFANDNHSHYRFSVTEPAGTVRVRTCIPYWIIRIVGCGVTVEKSPQGESCVTLHSANPPLPNVCSSTFPKFPTTAVGLYLIVHNYRLRFLKNCCCQRRHMPKKLL